MNKTTHGEMAFSDIGAAILRFGGPRIYGGLYAVWSSIRTIYAEIFASGYWRSACRQLAVSRNDEPLPWYSYPAIAYLSGQNWSSSTICEFGIGQSTLWWAKRAKRVIGYETNDLWVNRIRMSAQHYQVRDKIDFVPMSSLPVSVPHADVYVIDTDTGLAGWRTEIAKTIIRTGRTVIVILDNAESHTEADTLLKQNAVHSVVFRGYPPGATLVDTSIYWLNGAKHHE